MNRMYFCDYTQFAYKQVVNNAIRNEAALWSMMKNSESLIYNNCLNAIWQTKRYPMTCRCSCILLCAIVNLIRGWYLYYIMMAHAWHIATKQDWFLLLHWLFSSSATPSNHEDSKKQVISRTYKLLAYLIKRPSSRTQVLPEYLLNNNPPATLVSSRASGADHIA
jgi:hypothetical protein